MSVEEFRLIAVLGFLAIGTIALLASLAIVHLRSFAHHLKERDDLARLLAHRPAAWRQRC